MRIVFFLEMYLGGGPDSFLVNLFNAWPHPEDELILACNADHPGLSVIRSRTRRPLRIVPYETATYARLAARLPRTKLIKAVTPFLRYGYLAWNTLRARRLLERLNADRLMVVNGGYPGGDACRAAVLAWRKAAKPVLNIHSMAIPAPWHSRLPEAWLDARIARACGRIACVSHAVAKALTKRNEVFAPITDVIHNGITDMRPTGQAAPSALRKELGIPDDAPLCLMLATYTPDKGHAFVLEAFSLVAESLPKARLVFCGQGHPGAREVVARLVEEKGLAGLVHCLDFREDVASMLGSADVFVLGSQTFEGLSMVCLEAMCLGLPLVATDVGGNAESVQHGVTGFLVPPAAPDAAKRFAGHMRELLLDPEMRLRMGEAGRKRFEEYFTASRMAAGYARLLRGGHGGEGLSRPVSKRK